MNDYIPSIEFEAMMHILNSIDWRKLNPGSIHQKINPTEPSKTLSGQFLDVIDTEGNILEIRVMFWRNK